jgi:hypothetical protein
MEKELHQNNFETLQFKPKVDCFHGSKTLRESVKGHETFWKPLEQFLLKIRS